MTPLIWCNVCTPDNQADNATEFVDEAERGRWAAAHQQDTGHTSFTTYNLTAEDPE